MLCCDGFLIAFSSLSQTFSDIWAVSGLTLESMRITRWKANNLIDTAIGALCVSISIFGFLRSRISLSRNDTEVPQYNSFVPCLSHDPIQSHHLLCKLHFCCLVCETFLDLNEVICWQSLCRFYYSSTLKQQLQQATLTLSLTTFKLAGRNFSSNDNNVSSSSA